MHEPFAAFVGAFISDQMEGAFEKYDPELVISVHPLMQHVPMGVMQRRARRLGKPRPPFATVVTDFTTCHPTWFHAGVDVTFVATEECRQLALKKGLAPDQIVMHGLPTRPAFAEPLPERGALRERLGLHRTAPAARVVGGGDGMGIISQTVAALAKQIDATAAAERAADAAAGASVAAASSPAAPAGQIVVICGRNAKLADSLKATAWPASVKVVVKGFVCAKVGGEGRSRAWGGGSRVGPGGSWEEAEPPLCLRSVAWRGLA